MHGLGNDFVVIDAISPSFSLSSLPVAKLADRHTGIGFDQLLLIEKSKKADFFCRIFNADGSEAEQCGNGLRCVALFIHDKQLHSSNTFSIETLAGVFPVELLPDGLVRVTLPIGDIEKQNVTLSLPAESSVSLQTLSLGNPHAILEVTSIADAPVATLGPAISTHSHFKQGTNVGFMQVANKHHLHLRTYERGAGETNACGSNACAAALAAMQSGLVESPVKVQFRLGSLLIERQNKNGPVLMTGPAEKLFEGNFYI